MLEIKKLFVGYNDKFYALDCEGNIHELVGVNAYPLMKEIDDYGNQILSDEDVKVVEEIESLTKKQ